MQISDLFYKSMKDQFIIKDIYKQNVTDFAITESTPIDDKFKTICIDFGEINGKNEGRYIPVDVLILILKDFYGNEFLTTALNEIKPYEEIKNK